MENEEVVVEVKSDDYTEQAKSMGWNPEYDGPDKLDPKEFVLRKPLYDEMKKLRKKTRELETAVRTQQQVHEASLQRQKEDLLKQYKTAKIEAMEAGDSKRVVELDEAIEQTKQIVVNQPSDAPPPEFLEWVEKKENGWYSDDEDMRTWADGYGLKLYNANPQRPINEIYEAVSRKVRDVFPTKFKNPKRDEPSAVGEGGKGKTSDEGDFEIPKEYTQVFHTLFRAGAWGDKTKKEAMKLYAADLKGVE